MTTYYIITSTIAWLIMAAIWQNKNFLNIAIKLIMFGMAGWGFYLWVHQ